MQNRTYLVGCGRCIVHKGLVEIDIAEGLYQLDRSTVARWESVYPHQETQSVVKYETCLIQRFGRLSVESADDYGEWANDYVPTGESAFESADSEL